MVKNIHGSYHYKLRKLLKLLFLLLPYKIVAKRILFATVFFSWSGDDVRLVCKLQLLKSLSAFWFWEILD